MEKNQILQKLSLRSYIMSFAILMIGGGIESAIDGNAILVILGVAFLSTIGMFFMVMAYILGPKPVKQELVEFATAQVFDFSCDDKDDETNNDK
jgi:hypothetical protein